MPTASSEHYHLLIKQHNTNTTATGNFPVARTQKITLISSLFVVLTVSRRWPCHAPRSTCSLRTLRFFKLETVGLLLRVELVDKKGAGQFAWLANFECFGYFDSWCLFTQVLNEFTP